MKTFYPFSLLLAALIAAPLATASNAATEAPRKAQEKASQKKPAKKKQDDEKNVDTSDMEATAYDCDLGDKLTIFKKSDDTQEIALHWKKRTHRMQRMQTTSGAERFENADTGLVWIGIPAKGMLLDSKQGRQLANECRNAEQKKIVQK